MSYGIAAGVGGAGSVRVPRSGNGVVRGRTRKKKPDRQEARRAQERHDSQMKESSLRQEGQKLQNTAAQQTIDLNNLKMEMQNNEAEIARALHDGKKKGALLEQNRILGEAKLKALDMVGQAAKADPNFASRMVNEHARFLTGNEPTNVQVRVSKDGKSFGLFVEAPGTVTAGKDGVFREGEGGLVPFNGMDEISYADLEKWRQRGQVKKGEEFKKLDDDTIFGTRSGTFKQAPGARRGGANVKRMDRKDFMGTVGDAIPVAKGMEPGLPLDVRNALMAEAESALNQVGTEKYPATVMGRMVSQAAQDAKTPDEAVAKFRNMIREDQNAEMIRQLPEKAKKALEPGSITTFRNGQMWTLKSGKPHFIGSK